MNQPAKPSKTGITGWPRGTASDLRTSTENSRYTNHSGKQRRRGFAGAVQGWVRREGPGFRSLPSVVQDSCDVSYVANAHRDLLFRESAVFAAPHKFWEFEVLTVGCPGIALQSSQCDGGCRRRDKSMRPQLWDSSLTTRSEIAKKLHKTRVIPPLLLNCRSASWITS